MKSHLRWVAVATIFIASAAAVSAQGQNDNGGEVRSRTRSLFNRPLTSVMRLLSVQEIQAELKLTPEQLDKIAAKKQEQNVGRLPVLDVSSKTVDQDRMNQNFSNMREQLDRLAADEKLWLTELLNKDQKRQFDQLQLQFDGPMAIVDRRRPEIAERLKITDKQKKQFKEIDKEVADQYRTLYRDTSLASLTPEEKVLFMKKRDAILYSAPERKLALLTEVQQAQWKEMQGVPFAFPSSLQTHWNTHTPEGGAH